MVQVSKKYAVLCHQNAHEADMRRRSAAKKRPLKKVSIIRAFENRHCTTILLSFRILMNVRLSGGCLLSKGEYFPLFCRSFVQ